MIQLTIHSQELVAELEARGELLQAAILETMGGLGERLQELAQSKIAPVVRTAIGQELFDSIMLQAAAYVDAVCMTSVGIDNDGQPSYIVAYVREFGGEKWYDIYPHEVDFGIAGLSGQGRISPHSAEGSIAAEEGRLPHSLAWSEGGTMVFARHVWHPPAKEQSYLRSSLAEMQDEVRAALVSTIAEVLAA
jgi:hypothetical protein